MLDALLIVLAVGLAGFTALLLRERQRRLELASACGQLRASTRSSETFLSSMFSEMRGDGMGGAMQLAARHVADQCGAEGAAIYEMNNGMLRAVGVCGQYPVFRNGSRIRIVQAEQLLELLARDPIRPGEGFVGGAAMLEHAEMTPDVTADPRFRKYRDLEPTGAMAMPLRSASRLLGAVCLYGHRGGGAFTDDQFARFQELEPQLAMSLELMHAYGEISRRDRLDQELDLARRIQLSLLPKAFPKWGDFLVTASTRPAKEVNGDFYDFVKIDDDRLLVVIGDASGKGIPACLLSSMARSLIRAMADNFSTLEDFMRKLNRRLYRGTEEATFITLGCCLLDRRNSLIEFGRAGHTDLMVFIHDHIRSFSPNGAALGALPDELTEFDTFCTAFQPGMVLLLFSDGLTEALNARHEEFGSERLARVFQAGCRQGNSGRELIDLILEDVENFGSQNDDQTLIVIQHE